MRILVLKKIPTLLGALLASLLTLSLVIYPKEGVEAAVAGLKVFWEIVLPSLLPFFILSEVMLGMGVVHFIGVLLEPLMRPLFNVPGVGAFALSMGLAAGYPMDAVITAKFRRSGLCTRIEGERLLSFTNTADPLFIFGAVAVGMFGRPELGVLIGMAHYLSSFTVGIIFKYYHYRKGGQGVDLNPDTCRDGIIRRAFRALIKARRDDGRPIGKLMGDSVRESMSTLLMIGGFIIFFAVLVRILAAIGIVGVLIPVLAEILKILGIDPRLAHALFNGILEIDLGAMATSKALAPLMDKAMIAGWIIAWSGLSVHGQVASVIHDTDIRMTPYVIARFLHGVFAAWYTYLLMGPLAPVMGPLMRAVPVAAGFDPIDRIIFSGRQLVLGFGILIGLSLLVYFSRKYRLIRVKKTYKI
ncbi:MAG: sporulation integral membrane protein YlbJ [Firmicutes bacterium]|nr:sporulation integral membrane protein YlbJ [Bacillota bacterium]